MNISLAIAATAALIVSTLPVEAASILARAACGGGIESATVPEGRVIAAGGDDFCTGRSEAVAGPGYLGAAASVQTGSRLTSQGTSTAGAAEQYQLSITTPQNYTGGEIDFAVRFDFSGSVGGATDTNATENSLRFSSLSLFYSIGGNSLSGNGTTSDTITQTFQATEYETSTGPTFLFAGASSIVSNTLSILPTTVNLNMSLNARATIFSNDNPQVSAVANGLNTFNFASDGPAFILPEGFFVNSPEANIVNNYWIDPRVPEISAVPLPASLPLLAFAGMALGLAGRNRRKRVN